MNSVYNNFKSLCTELQTDCLTVFRFGNQDRISEQDFRITILAAAKLFAVTVGLASVVVAFNATVALWSGALISGLVLSTFAHLGLVCGHDWFKVAQNMQNPRTEATAQANQFLRPAQNAAKAARDGSLWRKVQNIYQGRTTVNEAMDHAQQRVNRDRLEGYASVITEGTWLPFLWTNLYVKIASNLNT